MIGIYLKPVWGKRLPQVGIADFIIDRLLIDIIVKELYKHFAYVLIIALLFFIASNIFEIVQKKYPASQEALRYGQG